MCATCATTAGSAIGAAAALGVPGLVAITVGRWTIWRERERDAAHGDLPVEPVDDRIG